MRPPKVLSATESAEQNRLVRELIAKLRAFLVGEIDRAGLFRWVRSLWPEHRGQGNPFRYGNACSVYDSLCNLDERDRDGHFMVREIDIADYIRDLADGERMEWVELVRLGFQIDELAAQCNTIATRWVSHGLGWHRGFYLCAPANGRPFYALEAMEHKWPGFVVYKHVDHDWTESLIDLFEAFAIDDRDVMVWPEQVDIAELPQWELVRGRERVDTFRSYAKALATQARLCDQGQNHEIRPLAR